MDAISVLKIEIFLYYYDPHTYPPRSTRGVHLQLGGDGGRRCATVASADPNDADFAHLEELNPGNSRRHMGVRETTAAGVRVPGTMGTDADELLALT